MEEFDPSETKTNESYPPKVNKMVSLLISVAQVSETLHHPPSQDHDR